MPYLGATPEGLIDDGAIIEVKCPESAASLSSEEAVSAKKLQYLKLENNELKLKRTHRYYYQVQGQLNITGRKYCIFAVWTPKGLFCERIERCEEFWQNMEPKLTKFYVNCILPEIIDPRFTRNMKIRDPDYIVEAMKMKQERKLKKTKQTEVEPCIC